jgi:hypothetical protein
MCRSGGRRILKRCLPRTVDLMVAHYPTERASARRWGGASPTGGNAREIGDERLLGLLSRLWGERGRLVLLLVSTGAHEPVQSVGTVAQRKAAERVVTLPRFHIAFGASRHGSRYYVGDSASQGFPSAHPPQK